MLREELCCFYNFARWASFCTGVKCPLEQVPRRQSVMSTSSNLPAIVKCFPICLHQCGRCPISSRPHLFWGNELCQSYAMNLNLTIVLISSINVITFQRLVDLLIFLFCELSVTFLSPYLLFFLSWIFSQPKAILFTLFVSSVHVPVSFSGDRDQRHHRFSNILNLPKVLACFT